MMRRSWLCSILFIVAVKHYRAQAVSGPTEDVQKMVGYFKDITEPSVDIVAKMNRISQQSAAFARLVFPVGALVAGALDIASQTGSEEYEALMELRKSMEKKFSDLEDSVQFSTKVIHLNERMADYNRDIRTSLDILQSEMELFWDPRFNKSDAKIHIFKTKCIRYDPKDLLIRVLNMVTRDCKTPSSLQTKHFAQMRQIFREIENFNVVNIGRTTRYDRQQFETQKQDVISTLLRHPNIAERIMEQIKWGFTSKVTNLRDVMPIIKRVFSSEGIAVHQSSCLLEAIIEGTKFFYDPIAEFLHILTYDVSRAVTFGGSCANITLNNVTRDIDQYMTQISAKSEKIYTDAAKYVQIKLEYAWPHAFTDAVNDFVGSKSIPKEYFDNFTRDLAGIVPKIGAFGYHYNVLVSTYEESRTGITTHGNEKFILNMTNLGGSDLIIARYIANERYRMAPAQAWLDPLKQKIYNIIDYNFNEADLENLLEKIERGVGSSLLNETRFHSLAVIRDTSVIQGNCYVYFHYSKDEVIDAQLDIVAKGIDFVEYYFRGQPAIPWLNCEHYLIFWFL